MKRPPTTSIVLPFPPSVNNYYAVARGRKILSRRGRDYLVVARCAIVAQQAAAVEGRVRVVIVMYEPDRRRRDIDNFAKAPLDAITKAGLIDDDSSVDDLRIMRRDLARPHGRIVVHIRGVPE